MRRIDQPGLRYLIKRGLQMLPKSVLRDLNSGAPVTRQLALIHAIDIIRKRLSRVEYGALDPLPPPFEQPD